MLIYGASFDSICKAYEKDQSWPGRNSVIKLLKG